MQGIRIAVAIPVESDIAVTVLAFVVVVSFLSQGGYKAV